MEIIIMAMHLFLLMDTVWLRYEWYLDVIEVIAADENRNAFSITVNTECKTGKTIHV